MDLPVGGPAALSADGTTAVAADAEGGVTLVRLANDTRWSARQDQPIERLWLGPSGRILLTATAKATTLYDRTRDAEHQLLEHPADSAAISPDGGTVAISGETFTSLARLHPARPDPTQLRGPPGVDHLHDLLAGRRPPGPPPTGTAWLASGTCRAASRPLW